MTQTSKFYNDNGGFNEFADRCTHSRAASDALLMQLRASIAEHARRASMSPTRAQLLLVNGVKPERGM